MALVALTGGCGGSSSDSGQSLYTYPDDVKATFMSSCMSAARRSGNLSNSKAQSACRCAVLRLQDRIPADRLGDTQAADVKDAMRDAIAGCT